MIQSMDRKGSEYIMNLVSCATYFFHCGKKYRLIIKIADYKFFYSHFFRFNYELRSTKYES